MLYLQVHYNGVFKFSDTQVWANSLDTEQEHYDQGLHSICHFLCIFWKLYSMVKSHCSILWIIQPKKNICVFQVSALKKLGMVGGHNILFYRIIFYRNCIFQYIFPHFLANLTTFCSQSAIKCLGSGQKPR